jgi:hypothetical protein
MWLCFVILRGSGSGHLHTASAVLFWVNTLAPRYASQQKHYLQFILDHSNAHAGSGFPSLPGGL